MSIRLIDPVSNNEEKQLTYAKLKSRYKRAMAYEFYFEALMIDYAIIEDRLKALLYYLGVLKTKEEYKLNNTKKVKTIKEIVCKYKEEDDDTDAVSISSISGKRKIVRALFVWANEAIDVSEDQKYLFKLKDVCESIDLEEIIYQLDKLKAWCAYRNEVVHALMNKSILSLESQIEEKAREGMEIANYFDNVEKQVKKMKCGLYNVKVK